MGEGVKHTPGPWSLYDKNLLIIVNSEGASLGEMVPGDPFIGPEEALANARMASGAPEVVETAIALLDRLYRSHLPSEAAVELASLEWQDARAKADALRAAIARAKGEPA